MNPEGSDQGLDRYPERFNRYPERFDRYMERCLYGPGGFYASQGTAGRRGGDFLTSPEVGPLFGAVLAQGLDRWWQELGEPQDWPIYDVGCGPGALLKAIELASPDRPWRYIGVDRVDAPGAQIAELPEDLSGAAVIANELLDNLPFRVIERTDSGYLEVFVDTSTGSPTEVLQPFGVAEDPSDGPTYDLGKLQIPVGCRAPLLSGATSWVTSVLSRKPSVLCLFDYGALTTSELAARGKWLRTYRQHQRGYDPLVEPGTADITSDIAWDQLPAPDSLEPQEAVLRSWGIETLVDEGRQYWKDHAAAPDLTAIRMRSRVSEVEALTDPDGLGAWWVALWRTSCPNHGEVDQLESQDG